MYNTLSLFHYDKKFFQYLCGMWKYLMYVRQAAQRARGLVSKGKGAKPSVTPTKPISPYGTPSNPYGPRTPQNIEYLLKKKVDYAEGGSMQSRPLVSISTGGSSEHLHSTPTQPSSAKYFRAGGRLEQYD